MNGSQPQPTGPASNRDQAIVSLLVTETTGFSSPEENPVEQSLELEHELQLRAGIITDVLTRIMVQRPPASRYWGLNE